MHWYFQSDRLFEICHPQSQKSSDAGTAAIGKTTTAVILTLIASGYQMKRLTRMIIAVGEVEKKMNDLISRQKAIDAIKTSRYLVDAMEKIIRLPSAQPELDEWCTDCKEYDQERHCCPRFTRVIKTTVDELKQAAQTEPDVVCHCNVKENAELIAKILDDDIDGKVFAMPERKTGHWEIYTISMIDGEDCRCSECGSGGVPYWNYCPQCGADMRGGGQGEAN